MALQRSIQGARKSWSESWQMGESCVTQEQAALESLLCAVLRAVWPPCKQQLGLRSQQLESVLLPVVWHFSEEINEAHIGAVTSSTTSVPPRPHPQKTGILGAVLFVSHHVSFLSVFLAVLLSLPLHVQVLTIQFLPHPLITPALCTPSHYPHSQSNLLSRGSLP